MAKREFAIYKLQFKRPMRISRRLRILPIDGKKARSLAKLQIHHELEALASAFSVRQ